MIIEERLYSDALEVIALCKTLVNEVIDEEEPSLSL